MSCLSVLRSGKTDRRASINIVLLNRTAGRQPLDWTANVSALHHHRRAFADRARHPARNRGGPHWHDQVRTEQRPCRPGTGFLSAFSIARGHGDDVHCGIEQIAVFSRHRAVVAGGLCRGLPGRIAGVPQTRRGQLASGPEQRLSEHGVHRHPGSERGDGSGCQAVRRRREPPLHLRTDPVDFDVAGSWIGRAEGMQDRRRGVGIRPVGRQETACLGSTPGCPNLTSPIRALRGT